MSGVAWAFVAALAFGLTQMMNRKANQLTDAFRTAFGLLVSVELLLLVRAALSGDLARLGQIPLEAVGIFGLTALAHFVGGWTLLAKSQQAIGVARTGSLVAAAPLLGSILAALLLGEPLTLVTLLGVSLAAVGVALISLSGASPSGRRFTWTRPWFALSVAAIWGSTPILLRIGLRSFDAPVLGLTVGLLVALVVQAIGLTMAGAWRWEPVPPRTIIWFLGGGVTGSLALSAQWLSFALTTVAIAITVQQLATLVVVGLAPVLFPEPRERVTLLLAAGTAAMLGGSALVVLAG